MCEGIFAFAERSPQVLGTTATEFIALPRARSHNALCSHSTEDGVHRIGEPQRVEQFELLCFERPSRGRCGTHSCSCSNEKYTPCVFVFSIFLILPGSIWLKNMYLIWFLSEQTLQYFIYKSGVEIVDAGIRSSGRRGHRQDAGPNCHVNVLVVERVKIRDAGESNWKDHRMKGQDSRLKIFEIVKIYLDS